jgi:hypothetical protein
MLVIQTGSAKRFRKYARFMALVLLLTGSFGALLTLHWYSPLRKSKAASTGGLSSFPFRTFNSRKKPPGRDAGRLSHVAAGPALLRFRRIYA